MQHLLIHLGVAAVVGAACAPPAPAPVLPKPATGLDGEARRDVIAAVSDHLTHEYVFPERAAEMVRAVTEHAAHGAYDGLPVTAFAEALTRDLQAISHDRHLRVWDHPAGPPPGLEHDGAPRAMFGRNTREGDVAVLEVTTFGVPLEQSRDQMIRAMTGVADAAALIIDLRNNRGGVPGIVTFMTSYLFGDRPVLFDTMTDPAHGTAMQSFTDPAVPGPHFGPTKPVFVLISHKTFSGAEELAYCLQALGRATVVGEASGGAAHAGGPVDLPHGMSMFVPLMRPVHPVTGTNWEGTGVVPDVAIAADQALDRALELARARIAN